MRIYGCLKITEGLSEKALGTLRNKLGTVSVLLYNVVDARMKHILDETADDLTNGFRISVANALASVQELMPELKEPYCLREAVRPITRCLKWVPSLLVKQESGAWQFSSIKL